MIPWMLVGALGCTDGIGGAINVTIDTDAPVPGGEELGFPPALFDRVVVETYLPGDDAPCSNCRRIAELDHDSLRAGDVSFGVSLPAGEDDIVMRVRAYRGATFPLGDPTRRGSIDVYFELPEIADGEVRDVLLFLPTDETGGPRTRFGTPRDAQELPEDWQSRVGTWEPAQPRDCSGQPWPGQVCIPGGAHWLPQPFSPPSDSGRTIVADEQLVVLSPFFVDSTETTVRTVLRSGLLDSPDQVFVWSGDEEGPEIGFRDWATFSGHRDRLDLPLNFGLMGWQRYFCLARGADLPSEAQFAALTGGLRSQPFPWGKGINCSDAWTNRTRPFSSDDLLRAVETRLGCAGPTGVFEAFRPVGTSGRDRIVLDGGSVEDITGNVGEITRDLFTEDPTPCWGTEWQRDPVCGAGFDPGTRLVVRGGALTARFDELGKERSAAPIDKYGLDVGFRCTRPGDDVQPPPIELDLVVGQGCHDASDCGTSPFAQCITREDTQFPFGGIVGGYCTRTCASDDECGGGSACERGHCMLRCNASTPAIIERISLVPTKCHGRHDLVCSDDFFYNSGEQLCFGSCATDAECGEGRYCDQKLGGCVDAPSPGAESGAACNGHGDCKGWCVEGVCGNACTAGGEVDKTTCGDPAEGVCNASLLYNSPGSLGYCYPRCSAHDECAPPNTHCVPFVRDDPFPAWWQLPSHFCYPAETCSSVGSSCGPVGLGLSCQDTPDGLRCLDPAIPWTAP